MRHWMTVLKLSHAAFIRTRRFCYLGRFLAEHTIRDTVQEMRRWENGTKECCYNWLNVHPHTCSHGLRAETLIYSFWYFGTMGLHIFNVYNDNVDTKVKRSVDVGVMLLLLLLSYCDPNYWQWATSGSWGMTNIGLATGLLCPIHYYQLSGPRNKQRS